MDRNQAYQLLTEYTTKDGLIKHALAVEAAMLGNSAKMKRAGVL